MRSTWLMACRYLEHSRTQVMHSSSGEKMGVPWGHRDFLKLSFHSGAEVFSQSLFSKRAQSVSGSSGASSMVVLYFAGFFCCFIAVSTFWSGKTLLNMLLKS